MAHPEFVSDILTMLGEIFNREPSEMTRAMYAKVWADIPDDELETLITAHLESEHTFPYPATIRKLNTEVQMKREGIPDVMEAWGQVRSRSEKAHPLAVEAFKQLGGWAAFGRSQESDEPTWRANFRMAYEAVIANERQRRTMSKASQQATGLLPAGNEDGQIDGGIRQLVDGMRLP